MAEDSLAPLPSSPSKKPPRDTNNTNNSMSHMKTYTAGEDGSRLAEAAKQLGLEHHRPPRKQVRNKEAAKGHHHHHRRVGSFTAYAADMLLGSSLTGQRLVQVMFQDSSVEVARMRAVYTLGYDYPRRAGSFSEYGSVQQSPQPPPPPLGGGSRSTMQMPEWLEQIEQEEVDAHAHGGVGGDLTSAVLGIVKGMVGPAILYLPHGLANTGYALAFPMILCSTAMFLYSSQCLLDAWRLEHDKIIMHAQQHDSSAIVVDRNETPTITEENEEDQALLAATDTEEGGKPQSDQQNFKMTFLSYPELAYRALGDTGEFMVKCGIAAMQSGVCLTYLIFVPQNFSTALHQLTGLHVSAELFLVVMVVVQIPLSWIRDIRKLTMTNFLANALILYGLITCLVLSLKQAISVPAPSIIGANETALGAVVEEESPLAIVEDRLVHLAPFAKDWFLFIGTSVLLFEGSITLLVPLQESVVSEEERKRFPSVYRTTILSVIVFYIFFSITCWMSLGNDVRTVLTTSLPPGSAATSVQLAYSIAVIFTFPLQNFPALEISCRAIANVMQDVTCCGNSNANNFLTNRNVISSLLVGLLAVVAVCTMDSLDKVVSLMGGLLGCPIAFIVPPLIHYKLIGGAGKLTRTRAVLNGIVGLLGVVATTIATVTTIMTW